MEESRQSPATLMYGEGAWIKYVLEFQMPNVKDADKVKEDVINMLKPLMGSAPRGNYENYDLFHLMWAYDDLWQKYFVYERKGTRSPDIIKLKDSLRMCFKMELTRGKKMLQMGMIFQPKQNIIQRLITGSRDKARFFKKKEPTEQQVQEMQ